MRKMTMTLALAATVLVATTHAMAQADGPRGRRGDMQGRGEGRGRLERNGRRGGPNEQGGRLRAILTEEQREQVREIMQDAREAASQAETPEQRRDLMQAARQKVDALLTEEQKAQLTQRRGRRGSAVELTDEQKEQVETLYKEALDKADESKNAAERIAIYEQVQKDIMAVLSEEQAKALVEHREGGPGLNLTDDQKAEIRAIRDAARLATALADRPRDKQAIARKAHNDAAAVLTEEQRAKVNRARNRRGQVRGDGPMRRRGMQDGQGRRGEGRQDGPMRQRRMQQDGANARGRQRGGDGIDGRRGGGFGDRGSMRGPAEGPRPGAPANTLEDDPIFAELDD